MKYLILHEVDGQPAFDIASKLETEEEIWIIPTSGHRAYPYRTWNLDDLMDTWHHNYPSMMNIEIPAEWPEHYRNERHTKLEPDLSDVLASLMAQVPKVFKRRF